MTPDELAAQIEALIVGNTEKFSASMIRAQNRLYSRIILTLKDLELDAEGYIKQSSVNRRILREAQNTFDEIIKDPAYKSAVESQLKIIPKVDALNVTYFTTVSKAFSSNKNFIKDLQKQVIRDVSANLLNEGVIVNVKQPLNNILSQNINSGGLFSGFNEQVRNFIKGNDQVEGRLLRYSKLYVKDTLFNYARGFQQSVVADLKLEWYSYSGGLMDTSRAFCRARAGNFYHQKEVESWAGQSWAGKNPGTTKSSIFTYCGGFSCSHQLIPVSDKLISEENKKRVAGV